MYKVLITQCKCWQYPYTVCKAVMRGRAHDVFQTVKSEKNRHVTCTASV